MISFYLNGQSRQAAPGDTIETLLKKEALIGKRIAVEQNGDIVPRSQYKETTIRDNDRIEIVVAVGGG